MDKFVSEVQFVQSLIPLSCTLSDTFLNHLCLRLSPPAVRLNTQIFNRNVKILTIADLNSLRHKEQLAPSTDVVAQHFHMVMKQALMGLPTESLLKAYPQINSWVLEVKSLLPKLFLLDPAKLLLDAQFQAPLCLKTGVVYIQITTNAILRTKNQVILIDWSIRHKKLNWYDQVKLWTVSEYLLPECENPKLIIIALHPERPATLCQVNWNQKQHKKTKTRLLSLLEKPRINREPSISLERKQTQASDIWLKLEEIEEVKI